MWKKHTQLRTQMNTYHFNLQLPIFLIILNWAVENER